jgi:hypothetical protein
MITTLQTTRAGVVFEPQVAYKKIKLFYSITQTILRAEIEDVHSNLGCLTAATLVILSRIRF